MNNPFEFSNTNKRYYTLDYYFKQKFNSKIGRIPINAGFTCPNINGEKSFDGCTFCNTKGSGDFAGEKKDSLLKQWEDGKKLMSSKWPNAKFIAYFQSFSNTYASVDTLKEKYEVFLNKEDCIGISIGTRADCIDEDIAKYLGELNKKTFLIVELGLQTSNEYTNNIINRCHSNKEFEYAVKLLKKYNINTVVHIINGLPKESEKDMINTIKYINKLNVDGVKIHLLHVMHNTKLVNQLNNGFLELLSMDDYIDIVVKQLEILNKDIVIHRLTGDAPSDIFIGPIWSKKKTIVLNNIDKELVKRNTWQGKFYETTN